MRQASATKIEWEDFSGNWRPQKTDHVAGHLREVLTEFLTQKPHLSVNGVSRRCGVSEPTLRRIMTDKIKTTPQTSTILDILTCISGSSSVREIVKKYPGPISEHLNQAMPFLEEFDQEYSNAINEELQDAIKYLIYKLALNHSGVTEEKILELYGNHGLFLLNDLLHKGYVAKKSERIFCAVKKTFSSRHSDFVRNFKVVADFIKPDKHRNRKPLNPFFTNCSAAITAETYEKIVRLQKRNQKRLRRILNENSGNGDIPFFYLCAIDTLDHKSAWEIEEEKTSS